MAAEPVRTVVVTASANPRTNGSVPQIGYQVAKGISDLTEATLIFHARDRDLVSWAFPPERLRFGGSRRLAEVLRRVSLRLFPDKWNFISMIEFIDFFLFDIHAYLIARRIVRRTRIDYVLRVNPISLLYPSLLPRLPVPVFTGPHNGGIDWPPGFAFLDRKEGTGSQFRVLGETLHRVYRDIGQYRGIFIASEMCARSVPGVHRDKLVFFPENGVDGVKPRAARAGDATRLLFVGRLVPFKGIDLIIRALPRLPERVELTLVGDGPQRDELEALALELRVSRRCHFLGWRAHSELDPIYAEAGVFVFPSVRETGGAVVLEAMSHGLPCLVADWGGPATYTRNAGIHLSVESPKALEDNLVSALRDLLDDPESGRKLGEAAQDALRSEYVWSTKAQRLHATMLERAA